MDTEEQWLNYIKLLEKLVKLRGKCVRKTQTLNVFHYLLSESTATTAKLETQLHGIHIFHYYF